MTEQIVYPKHSWFEYTQLRLTETTRFWERRPDVKIPNYGLSLFDRTTVTKNHNDPSLDIDDIHFTFAFLSTERDSLDPNVAELLLKTPLPEGFQLYQRETADVRQGQITLGEEYELVSNICFVYEELFSEIGSNRSDDKIIVNGRKINGHPDSVYLELKQKSLNELTFGYAR